jgi:hypothetical protein
MDLWANVSISKPDYMAKRWMASQVYSRAPERVAPYPVQL